MLEKLLPYRSRRRRRFKEFFLGRRIPERLERNFRRPDDKGLEALEKSLRNDFFSGDDEYLSTENGKIELADQLTERLDEVRRYYIPWMDDAEGIYDTDVLEIGCGTGIATVALAEQEAAVTAIDTNVGALAAARKRCEVYDLHADFHQASATQIAEQFAGREFDTILVFACLEHLLPAERLNLLKQAWQLLRDGGLLCVADTPNRLWYFDNHSSMLPFFHWLPPALASKYSRFSPRAIYNEVFDESRPETGERIQRMGRGASYHEFELAIAPMDKLDVISYKAGFLAKRSIPFRLARAFTSDARYRAFLSRAAPNVHPAFVDMTLDVIIRKPA